MRGVHGVCVGSGVRAVSGVRAARVPGRVAWGPGARPLCGAACAGSRAGGSGGVCVALWRRVSGAVGAVGAPFTRPPPPLAPGSMKCGGEVCGERVARTR